MESTESTKLFSKGFFMVTGSKMLRFGETYKATVFCHGYDKEEELLMRIVPSDKNTKNPEYKKIKLSGDNVQVIDIDIEDMIEGDYNLEVKNESGEKFEATRSLDMNMKKFSVFIQTDKSMYKPSDNIQFRILALDADTKPLQISSVEIYITDGADNRVKQYDDPKFHKGVFQSELQLSDSPVMGSWKIHVKINDQPESTKTFEVAEYVLPKFEVSIDSTPNVTYKDGKIKATVKANYTFGKIAKGNATVTAEVLNQYGGCVGFGWNQQPEFSGSNKVEKTVEVDGKKFVEFDIEKDLNIIDTKAERIIKLTASFKEELSEKEATASTNVKIHITPHKVELKQSSEKFKPGLPFDVTAIVQFHDKNVPVTDDKNAVKFSVTYYWEVLKICKEPHGGIVAGRRMRPNEEYEVWERQSETKDFNVFPSNGFAKLNIELKKATTHFSVKAKYLETEEMIHHIDKMETECNEYLMARLLTEKPLLSENVAVEILSTKTISQLSYQIFGRGSSVESASIHFEPTNNYVLNIKPTLLMIPKAQLVVCYLTSDGEIISDRTEIEFGNEFINQIDIKLSAEQVNPGSNMDISVTTNENSLVGLLGVDQSVLLLKKGNDIEHSTVFDELSKYGETERFNYSYYHQYHDRDNPDFQATRALFITNAKNPFSRYTQDNMGGCYSAPMAKMVARNKVMAFGAPAPMVMADMVQNDGGEMFAMEMAVGASAPPMKKPVEVRKEFPETWLFDSLDFDSSTSKVISKKVPDTITSWIITGFSIDPEKGLALTKQPSKFSVFQPFFASTNLPYSVKRGESISIPVILFNYMEEDQEVEVVFITQNPGSNEDDSKDVKKAIVKSNEATTVSFDVKPAKVGDMTIKIEAESILAGDKVEKQLKVEPEGVARFFNESMFIDLRNGEEFKRTINIEIPSDAVPDSTHIEIAAIGDILGTSINNLDKLIQLPYGCGEQNMLNFVPNIVILDYLTGVKQLTKLVKMKAKKFMEVGYQRELTYKHDDGSYSAFGKSDQSGSTWLTAFVAKSFYHASKYINVDKLIILEALKFLKNVQANDGSFPEVGYICHQDMQGGSSKGIALTAYTLITFIEIEDHRKYFDETIKKAINYIVNNYEQLSDNYSLALATYALQLAQHEKKEEFLKNLNSKAELKDGLKFWTKQIVRSNDDNSRHFRLNSVNVEMTAYALQALIAAGCDADGISIMKWLISQRNENGGFNSTQDTVVGLQALSKMASKIYHENSEIEVSVKSEIDTKINVDSSNSLVLQKFEVPSSSRQFEISAKGKGFSILQISYKYNVNDADKQPRFEISPEVDNKLSSKEFLILNVGIKFICDENIEKSNMAVMEVALPSGFTFDNDSIEELLGSPKVKKVETKDAETIVVVYFDDIDVNGLRPQIKAFRAHEVSNQKPSAIVVYDYYDNSRRGTAFYSPSENSKNVAV